MGDIIFCRIGFFAFLLLGIYSAFLLQDSAVFMGCMVISVLCGTCGAILDKLEELQDDENL